MAPRCLFLLSTLPDMRGVAACRYGLPGRFARIAFVRTEMLNRSVLSPESLPNTIIQRGFQEFHIVGLGAAHDQRQRDSTLVDE